MKYEFIKIDLDTYKLVYTNKEKKEVSIEFKRTIEMAEKLQGIVATARLNMYKELNQNQIAERTNITQCQVSRIIKKFIKECKKTYNGGNKNEPK